MHQHQGVAILLALGIFAMNLRMMAPTITAGDSAELSTAQSTLGIAHSPGYPFFVLTGKVFSSLMPFGNPAYKTNLFSVSLSFFIALFLIKTIFLWTQSVWLSVSATLFFLFVPVIREQFLSTEVFALNMLTVMGILFLVSKIYLKPLLEKEETGRLKILCLIAFIFGLGMGNQHTLILLAPSIVLLYLIYSFKNLHLILFFRFTLYVLCFFILGFSIYFLLPIRSFQQPLLDWEDPQTWERFWGVLTRARYGTFQLAQGQMADLSVDRFVDRTIFLFKEIFHQLNPIISLLWLLGIVFAFLRKEFRWIASAFFLLLFFSGPFFLMLSNVGTGAIGYEILSRFLPMPFLAFFLMGILGLSHKIPHLNPLPLREKEWVRVNPRPLVGMKWVRGVISGLLLISFVGVPEVHSLRNHFLVYDYGKNVLKTLPEKSLLFSDRADEVEFSLAYLLYAEGTQPSMQSRRKDIQFIDCNAGVTRSIYGEDYYKIWGKPRLAIRELKEKEIIQKSQNPVFYATVEPEMIAIPRRAEGILFTVTPLAKSSPESSPFQGEEHLLLNKEKAGMRIDEKESKKTGEVWMWDEFYTIRYDLKHLGFRGIPFFSSYAQLMGKYFLNLPPLHLPLAKGERQRGIEKSRDFFRMLALSEPTGSWNHPIALKYMEKGEIKIAEEFFLKAVQRGPEKDKVLCNLGILYERQTRNRKAEESYKKAIKFNPASFQAHYNLGVLYWKEGRWQDVIGEFEAVLKIEPKHAEAKRYLQLARERAR